MLVPTWFLSALQSNCVVSSAMGIANQKEQQQSMWFGSTSEVSQTNNSQEVSHT